MKRLLKILAGLGLVLLVGVVVAYFLPRHYRVSRSITIQAAPERVWTLVGDLRSWRGWGPWYEMDPAMVVRYSTAPGPTEPGGWVEWESTALGGGRMTVQQSHPPGHLQYQLSLPDWDSTSVGEITLRPTAGGLAVTWSDSGDLGLNPVKRWLGLAFDRMMGPDFEAGLANLKSLAETTG